MRGLQLVGWVLAMGCGTDASTVLDAASDAELDGSIAADAALDSQADADASSPDAFTDAQVETGMDVQAPDGDADAGPVSAVLAQALRMGTNGQDALSAVAVASDGTAFASGSVRGPASLTIGPHVLPFTGGAQTDLVVFARAPDGSFPWARRFPGPALADTGLLPSTALTVDAAGALWFGGQFTGPADLGDGVMRNAAWLQCYVMTLDPVTGVSTVQAVLGDTQHCTITDIVVRPTGGFAITGQMSGTLDLGGGTLNTGGPGQYVAEFDATGAHRWSHGFVNAIPGRMSSDAAGNLTVCGGARPDTDIGTGTPTIATPYAPFISSFTPTGAVRWAIVHPNAHGACYGIATAASGRSAAFLLAAGSSGRLMVGGTSYPAGTDLLLGLTAGGSQDWSRPLTLAWGFVQPGPGGNVLLTGFIQGGSIDLGGAPYSSRGSADAIVAQYTIDTGVHQWSGGFGSMGVEIARTVAPNGSGGAWIAGTAQNDTSPFASGDFGGRDFLLFEVSP